VIGIDRSSEMFILKAQDDSNSALVTSSTFNTWNECGNKIKKWPRSTTAKQQQYKAVSDNNNNSAITSAAASQTTRMEYITCTMHGSVISAVELSTAEYEALAQGIQHGSSDNTGINSINFESLSSEAQAVAKNY